MNEAILPLGLMEDENIALDDAALALAALDHPGLDLAPYNELLSVMEMRLLQQRAAVQSAYDQALLLASIIAGEQGFSGDTEDYDNPVNADLIAVIDRKRGLPIALSILYVALARRLGWRAVGLNTPGHLLVRIGAATAGVIIDPFNRGAVLGQGTVAELLARFGGDATTLAAIEPLSNRAMLVRLLLNQATRARHATQTERALILYQRMTTVAPLMTHLWWDRAELERELGHITAARASLNAMLETTRDDTLRSHVRSALARLARSIH